MTRENGPTPSFEVAARIVQRANWDLLARQWDHLLSRQGLNTARVDLFSRYLASPALLLGAGRGNVLLRLREMLNHAVGIDWSTQMVARAKRDGVDGLGAADAAALPFGDASFRCAVLSTGVLMPTHEESRMRRYFAEAYRVVEPGGTVVACLFYEPDSESARGKVAAVRLPLHTVGCFLFWDLSGVEAAARAAGLRGRTILTEGDLAVLVTRKP